MHDGVKFTLLIAVLVLSPTTNGCLAADSLKRQVPRPDGILEDRVVLDNTAVVRSSKRLHGTVTTTEARPALVQYAPLGFHCVREGVTKELPARVLQVIQDSIASQSGILRNDRVIDTKTSDGTLVLTIERGGKIYSAPLNTTTLKSMSGLGDRTSSQQDWPHTLKAWLNDAHPHFAAYASTIGADTILVVEGDHDDATPTLEGFGIPLKKITAQRLCGISLDGVKVVVINCDAHIPERALTRIRDFVATGGYLLTTDWELDNSLALAFPGYVQWNSKLNHGLAACDAEPVERDPILFNHAITKEATWAIDNEAHFLKIVNPEAVHILVRSRQLQAQYPDTNGVLAIAFSYGRGQVLHLVGHFGSGVHLTNALAGASPKVRVSLRQMIAANFIVAGAAGKQESNIVLDQYAPLGFCCIKEGYAELPARIIGVSPGSPAQQQGLVANDRIVKFNTCKNGITLAVQRGGKLYTANLVRSDR
jgi:hypothetical protein